MGILVADYGSDSEGASDSDGDDAAGGEIVLEPAEATTAPARGGDGEAGGERERDDAPAGTSTKRALEPETPPEASKYVAYGGGWYDRAGNYCWISPDGTLHLLRPGATEPEISAGDDKGGGDAPANDAKRVKAADIASESMEFPQHKISILRGDGVKAIATKTGARLRITEGKMKTGSVRKGIMSTLTITGTRDAVKLAKADAIAMLDANGARSTKDASTGKYEFKGRQVYNDTYVNGEKPRVAPEFDWRHSGMGWDNGGLTGTDGACGAHCTWKKS